MPRQTNIVATVFGGHRDKNRSAYDSHLIDDVELGVSLPYHFKGKPPKVRLFKNGREVVASIVDVGPWYDGRPGWPADPYWEHGTRPKAETDGRTNHAGIDLTPALAGRLGIGGKGTVDWEFVSPVSASVAVPPVQAWTAHETAPAAFPASQDKAPEGFFAHVEDAVKAHLPAWAHWGHEPVPSVPPEPSVASGNYEHVEGEAKLTTALLDLAHTSRQAIQAAAARRLATVGERYPHNGCAITQTELVRRAGVAIEDKFLAIELGRFLRDKRGWKVIPVGEQKAGDIGSTCFDQPHHGTDHVYFVVEAKADGDTMVIFDNQSQSLHTRSARGHGGKSPTQFFLRAPH